MYIKYDDKEIRIDYFTFLYDYPEREELFSAVVDDAKSAYHYETFDDFCSTYGYSDDSIKALKIFESCKEMKDKLHDLLGEELFTKFMECEMDL